MMANVFSMKKLLKSGIQIWKLCQVVLKIKGYHISISYDDFLCKGDKTKVKLFTIKEIKKNKDLSNYLVVSNNGKVCSVMGINVKSYKKLAKRTVNVRVAEDAYIVSEDKYMPFYIGKGLIKEVYYES